MISLEKSKILYYRDATIGDEVLTPFSYYNFLGIQPFKTYIVIKLTEDGLVINNGINDVLVDAPYMMHANAFHYCQLYNILRKCKFV